MSNTTVEIDGNQVELYVYKAKVLSAYDGDTIRVDINLGCNTVRHNESIRLLNINTPEVRGVERAKGLVSRDWVREKLVGRDIVLKTVLDKTGKFGRLLGVVYLDGININNLLVSEGLAEYKKY